MAFKETGKLFRRFLARNSLYLCSLTVKLLPKLWLYCFAEIVAFLGYHIAIKQRKIALESLGIAFGESLSYDKRRKIALDCFKNMAKSGLELLYILENPSFAKGLVDVEGEHNLSNALNKGNGVIAVSAHFGNFPLALTKLRQAGYKVNVVLKRMRDDKVENFLEERRKNLGIKSIYASPRQLCVESSLKALRNNEILFIQLDQNFGTAGVFVDFFGEKAATATGPVVFALRTQAAVVPLFIVREENDKHKIIIEPEVIIEKKDTQEETLQFNIQKITTIIETYIRKYPEEWGWIHRRWKSRPAV